MLFSRHHNEHHKGSYRENRRHLADRRHGHDRRAEVRFEPGNPDRRQQQRRRRDRDPWQDASHEH